jgi:flagellar hook assembly protein FlgD
MESVNKGVYSITWHGKNTRGEPAVSGVYFYQIIAGDKQLINKMSLVK